MHSVTTDSVDYSVWTMIDQMVCTHSMIHRLTSFYALNSKHHLTASLTSNIPRIRSLMTMTMHPLSYHLHRTLNQYRYSMIQRMTTTTLMIMILVSYILPSFPSPCFCPCFLGHCIHSDDIDRRGKYLKRIHALCGHRFLD